MNKTFEIVCPECKGTLVIDASSGAIISHEPYKRKAPSLEEFLNKESNKSSILEEKFRESKEKEKRKFEELEKKFAAAKKNKNLKDPPPSILWD